MLMPMEELEGKCSSEAYIFYVQLCYEHCSDKILMMG
jgi:hypothetical protein